MKYDFLPEVNIQALGQMEISAKKVVQYLEDKVLPEIMKAVEQVIKVGDSIIDEIYQLNSKGLKNHQKPN